MIADVSLLQRPPKELTVTDLKEVAPSSATSTQPMV